MPDGLLTTPETEGFHLYFSEGLNFIRVYEYNEIVLNDLVRKQSPARLAPWSKDAVHLSPPLWLGWISWSACLPGR
jgi:hypothetical protein